MGHRDGHRGVTQRRPPRIGGAHEASRRGPGGTVQTARCTELGSFLAGENPVAHAGAVADEVGACAEKSDVNLLKG